eukprot:CAMPEP_0201574394 /NCGR_PEP_ID=MMETSP0190_2-20130828/18854_1 /ASSEMBLY_ACC=CAM_ASM_000263 /TAXON_ID=37353 /ORGANISM="Rosalina sp." /LENGTH=97 /DNA_ID=CAMNT_0048002589 /DNA_START=591 /DNA_END=884 /DNA_ORIENTATION=+
MNESLVYDLETEIENDLHHIQDIYDHSSIESKSNNNNYNTPRMLEPRKDNRFVVNVKQYGSNDDEEMIMDNDLYRIGADAHKAMIRMEKNITIGLET